MKSYTFLLFDADNTLLDFDANEAVSIRATLEHFGVPPTEEVVQLYSGINLCPAHLKFPGNYGINIFNQHIHSPKIMIFVIIT